VISSHALCRPVLYRLRLLWSLYASYRLGICNCHVEDILDSAVLTVCLLTDFHLPNSKCLFFIFIKPKLLSLCTAMSLYVVPYKTVAVKTVKLVTLVGRPPVTAGHSVTEPVLWRYTWSLLHNVATCLSWILATVSHFVLHILGDLKVYNFLYHTVHGPKSSFVSRTACCPANLRLFSTSTDSRSAFSNGNWHIAVFCPIHLQVRVPYLISGFHRDVVEICALPWCYTAYGGNFLTDVSGQTVGPVKGQLIQEIPKRR